MSNFDDIIDISHLFKNDKFTISQWKQKHRDEVLDYHKNYNKQNKVWEKMGGNCEVCNNRFYGNLSCHKKTKKHLNNLSNQLV